MYYLLYCLWRRDGTILCRNVATTQEMILGRSTKKKTHHAHFPAFRFLAILYARLSSGHCEHNPAPLTIPEVLTVLTAPRPRYSPSDAIDATCSTQCIATPLDGRAAEHPLPCLVTNLSNAPNPRPSLTPRSMLPCTALQFQCLWTSLAFFRYTSVRKKKCQQRFVLNPHITL